ncbi:hypothetical protein Tco_0569047 [Tanacetum coccineum]
MYDYGYLEEIEVRHDDQKLYTFKEVDLNRLRLQDIENMLLLLVQQKLTNLTIDEIKIHVLNQSSTKYYEKEEEKIDDEETMDEEEDDEATKELYDDVNVNLGNEDTNITNADQGASEQQNVSQESGFEQVEEDAYVTLTPVLDTQKADEPVQSSSVSSDFTSKLLNLENPSRADNEITSLMETSARHATTIFEITSGFTTTIPPLPLFFNPLPQQETPTTTPTTFEATTSFTSLSDFSFVFKFNESVTNLEKNLLEIKQVDQYALALSSITAIVDRYIDNKLGEAINKAIQAHNLDCRQEAQDEKNEYIGLVDTSMRTIIKEEVTTQIPHIPPQVVSDFATLVIERNVTESLEAAVLARSSSQPKSTYEAAASLSEFELTKILLDKMEESKSHLRADYKKKLYDVLVESYNTEKDLFDTYGEVFTLKRSQDDNDKDRDSSAGSDRGTKRRKSSKEAESSKDSRSKEKKSSRTSKDASQSQHKFSDKSSHAEEPSHTVDDSGVQQDQEFKTGNNDEQLADKERQHVDSRPPQTWISQVVHAKEPRTSFDELMDTSFNFSAFVLNRLNIKDLTQEILVGPAFELLKSTCKSLTELEYHLEECSKEITERLDWHNLEGKPYPFDLNKPLSLIRDHRGRQVIPRDFFINNDLEYLKDGDLSRRYSTLVTKTKATTYEIKWIEDLVRNLWSPVKDVYSRKRIITVTRLTIMKKYDYGHLEEIEKLTNLTIDERYALNVALCMFTRRIVIQRRVEDLQLGVESYQKKLNLTKPDTFRLMHDNELYKFNDGTLDDVRSTLNDIAKGIRMGYLLKRKWSGLDKRRAQVMIQDIDKQLYERRLMQNVEKFVGRREY